MSKQIFYAGFKMQTSDPVDERLYIDSLTVNNLKSVFGSNGQYGFSKAVIFVKDQQKFYCNFDFTAPVDIVNVSKWSAIGENVVEFPSYVTNQAYGLGSCVSFQNSFNSTSFYIGLAPITAGQNPETNPNLWLNLSASSTVTVHSQTFLKRIDTRVPQGNATRKFTVIADNTISNNGTRIPAISIFANHSETISGQPAYELVRTSTKYYKENGQVKFEIEFSGDLSDIFFDLATSSQTNVIVTLT